MKILIIGSGGREHALVWKLVQSPLVKKIYCAPGNDGMAKLAECVSITAEDIPELLHFAQKQKIDLTVVGPELPLSKGIADEFEKAGLKIFGPRKNAAILESSKCFTKEFCSRHSIPTAPFTVFHDATEAKKFLETKVSYPIVIKADGLAQGKGVVIAKNIKEAHKVIDDMMVYEKFGDAGRRLLIEEFLPGVEATFMVATDGRDFVCFESAQDHKQVFDDDRGPNTGGMGAYSPAPVVTPAVQQKIVEKIIQPLLKGMFTEDRPYRGILYAGLMIHEGEPRLIEFNCRFGDPEAQVILYRLDSDLVELMLSCLNGNLARTKVHFTPQPAVCVVMASGGYPGSYDKGKVIKGLDKVKNFKNSYLFHAGTKWDGHHFITHGGRVLGVTSKAKDLKTALSKAYFVVDKISWEGMHFRRDIGRKGL